MPAPRRYRPCCLVCYTTHLSVAPMGKRDAERIAVSHMNAYGHNTTVQEVTPEAKRHARTEGK